MNESLIKNKKVLVLEDDRLLADSLKQSLLNKLKNIEVTVVHEPARALDLIDEGMPDLLLADLHLGDRNLLTLLNEMASYPDTLALPKIILSSSGRQLRIGDLTRHGVRAIYDKRTYDFNELVAKIWELIDGD